VESALAWIGQIAAWIGQWIPRWTLLDSTEGAVKFEGFFLPASCRRYKGSMRTSVCEPGLHWYWPATTSLQSYPTAFQTDNLPSQTMETADGIPITVGGMLTYTVDDLSKLLTQTHSAVKMIQFLTLAAIHDVCCNLTWEALRNEQRRGTLDTKLKNAAQRQLTDFGVRVVKCMLTDMAKTRVYRLIQSTQMDNQ
jgi:regulator of protease activity HflC (stomatin/prohibitin superfamily)